MHLLSPSEAQELWPLMTVDDVVGAAFLPTDGQANPTDITMALARGARQAGATICEDTEVLGDRGRRRCDQGGRHVAGTNRMQCRCVLRRPMDAHAGGDGRGQRAAGVGAASVRHHDAVRSTGVPRDLPTLRDPDRLTYYKEEVGGLVMGGYEPNPIPWATTGSRSDFNFKLLDSDFDHFAPTMELAMGRVPALQTAGINELINGPESFTPDGNFILGEAPELKNFFVGAGFNAFGIAAGGGAGMALAEWVHRGVAPYDLWVVDIRRFGRPHQDTDWVRTRTLEAYGKHYTMAWPNEEHDSGRPCRTSPLYSRLLAAGACFGEKLGWERPNWFAAPTSARTPTTCTATSVRTGSPRSAASTGQPARRAVLIDQTSFAKFALKGPDAQASLNWICSNNVDKPVGSLTYTQMLDDSGGIQCDLTVCRIATDEFYIVTGTGFATHDFDWIQRSIPAGANAQLFDITSANCVLSLMGPRSRDVLQAVTRTDLSNETFPFGTQQIIGVAGCPVRALRVTYVGELGWELHLPVEYATSVYDALMDAGADHGLINAGYRAIESCRLEKGYRAWGSDIGPDHTPIEAGLGWALKLRTEIDFRGRHAVASQRTGGVRKMLAGFTCDPAVVLLGRGDHLPRRPACRLADQWWVRLHDRSLDRLRLRAQPSPVSPPTSSPPAPTSWRSPAIECPADVSLHPFYDPTNARVKS